MHPARKIVPITPYGGYNIAIRFEKPINEKGIEMSIIIRTQVVYGSFKEYCIL